MEAGLIVGLACALAGLTLALWSVWYWSRQGFGDLEPHRVLRRVIPGATLLTLGGQIVLVGFFLGVFQLAIRSPSADEVR